MSLSYKNKLENVADVTKNSAGMSGADLAQKGLEKLSGEAVGAGKDGARFEQLAGANSDIYPDPAPPVE